jgi:hypothetical protein
VERLGIFSVNCGDLCTLFFTPTLFGMRLGLKKWNVPSKLVAPTWLASDKKNGTCTGSCCSRVVGLRQTCFWR